MYAIEAVTTRSLGFYISRTAVDFGRLLIHARGIRQDDPNPKVSMVDLPSTVNLWADQSNVVKSSPVRATKAWSCFTWYRMAHGELKGRYRGVDKECIYSTSDLMLV